MINSAGSVFNVKHASDRYSVRYLFYAQFSGSAMLSCSTDRSNKMLGRQLWGGFVFRDHQQRQSRRANHAITREQETFTCSKVRSSSTCVASFNAHISACARNLM